MLTVDRHLLISCAPRYVGSSKQLRSVKNTEKQDVANPAVVAEMVEAHVCILHFQLLDKHFLKDFFWKQDWADKHSNLYLQAWLHLYLFHDCWVLGCRVTPAQGVALLIPSLSLSWDAHTRWAGWHPCPGLSSEVFVLLTQLTYQGKHQRQARRIFHSMSPEMQVSKSCPGNAGGYAGLDGKSHLKFWLGSA